jgi:hypothetical protein
VGKSIAQGGDMKLKLLLLGEILILSLLPTGWLVFSTQPPGLRHIAAFLVFCVLIEARHRYVPAVVLGSIGFFEAARGWWLIVLAIGFSVICIYFGTAYNSSHLITEQEVLKMMFWCLVQQFALTSCFRRFEVITNPLLSVILTTAVFSMAHYPNLPVMLLTFTLSIIVLPHFYCYRSLWLISLFHFITKLTLLVSFPPEWFGYFTAGKRFVELAKVVNLPKFVTWLLNG